MMYKIVVLNARHAAPRLAVLSKRGSISCKVKETKRQLPLGFESQLTTTKGP